MALFTLIFCKEFTCAKIFAIPRWLFEGSTNRAWPSQPFLPNMKIAVPRVKMFTHKRANRDVGRSENMGGANDNAEAPLVEIWLTDLPKAREVWCPTTPSGSDIPVQMDTQFWLNLKFCVKLLCFQCQLFEIVQSSTWRVSYLDFRLVHKLELVF